MSKGNPRQATVKVAEVDAAWAAGFFDGEGCVSIRVAKERYVNLTIILVQKDIRPLHRIQEIFGADEKIGVVQRTFHKRPYFRLTFAGDRAAYVLTAMLPYLALKKEVAEVGLQLQAEINRFSFSDRLRAIPSDSVALRKELAEKVKWLNTGRWAAAETKSSGLQSEQIEGCDSPACNDGKVAEGGRNARPSGFDS